MTKRDRLMLLAVFVSLCAFESVATAETGVIGGALFSGMAERSLLVPGHTSRLQAAMQKAREGHPLTIGFIGGSITAGASASKAAHRYTFRVTNWFTKKFPQSKVSYVGAGIGGTGSHFGAYRVQSALLSKKPDIVFVEFSVNDSATAGATFSMEALLRQILSAPNEPAVVMIGMLNQDGVNAQEAHAPVARHYGLPYISVKNALWPEIQNGRAPWASLFSDNVHPNDEGHALVAQLVRNYLDQLEMMPRPKAAPEFPEPLDSTTDDYRKTALAHAGSDVSAAPIRLVENRGWTILPDSRHGPAWESTAPGSEISFEIEGTQMALLVHKGNDQGTIEYSVDGGPFQTLSLYRGDRAQNNSALQTIGKFDEAARHLVVIRHSDKTSPESSGNRVELRMLLTAGFSAGKE